MLTEQRAVNEETRRIAHAIARRKGQRVRVDELDLKRLGEREMNITKDASKAQSMLEADGSSMVLLSVMEDTRDLMVNVSELLAKFRSGAHTQALEKDIEQALEDMLAAVQEERRRREEMAEEMEPGEGQGEGGQQQQPLVQLSAELKMLKALQLRVNAGTASLDAGRAKIAAAELSARSAKLARREERIGRLTRDLANKLKVDRAARGGAPGM